jgi:hypothetical protein
MSFTVPLAPTVALKSVGPSPSGLSVPQRSPETESQLAGVPAFITRANGTTFSNGSESDGPRLSVKICMLDLLDVPAEWGRLVDGITQEIEVVDVIVSQKGPL